MLRPIAPFVEYAINYDYISKVLCINKEKVEMNCNGKCYVMKQLKKQQDEDFKSLRVSMKDYPIGFINLLQIEQKTEQPNALHNNFFYQLNYSYLVANSVFHPPTV